MFKGKKIIITIVVLSLMLAMTINVYAVSYTCTLHPTNTGYAYTSSVTSDIAHSAGFNQPYSQGNMDVNMQRKITGGWQNFSGKTATPGTTVTCSTWKFLNLLVFRTRIKSSSGQGGVSGVGSINDY